VPAVGPACARMPRPVRIVRLDARPEIAILTRVPVFRVPPHQQPIVRPPLQRESILHRALARVERAVTRTKQWRAMHRQPQIARPTACESERMHLQERAPLVCAVTPQPKRRAHWPRPTVAMGWFAPAIARPELVPAAAANMPPQWSVALLAAAVAHVTMTPVAAFHATRHQPQCALVTFSESIAHQELVPVELVGIPITSIPCAPTGALREHACLAAWPRALLGAVQTTCAK
jgi:hypothetical protein